MPVLNSTAYLPTYFTFRTNPVLSCSKIAYLLWRLSSREREREHILLTENTRYRRFPSVTYAYAITREQMQNVTCDDRAVTRRDIHTYIHISARG